jgi:hypothetical protein
MSMKSELDCALKNNVFCGFGPCNVVKIYWRFGVTDHFRLRGLHSPICESLKSQKMVAAPPKVKFHIAVSTAKKGFMWMSQAKRTRSLSIDWAAGGTSVFEKEVIISVQRTNLMVETLMDYRSFHLVRLCASLETVTAKLINIRCEKAFKWL